MSNEILSRDHDRAHFAVACAAVTAGEAPPEALVDWLQERGADLPGVLRLYAGTAAQGYTDGLPQSVLAAWCVATGDAARGAQVAAVTDDAEAYIRYLHRSLDVDEEYRDYLVRWEARRRPVDVPTDLPFVVRARAVAAAATTRDRKRRVLGLFGEVRYRDERFLSWPKSRALLHDSVAALRRILAEMGLPRCAEEGLLNAALVLNELSLPRVVSEKDERWSVMTLRYSPALRVRHDYTATHLVPSEERIKGES